MPLRTAFFLVALLFLFGIDVASADTTHPSFDEVRKLVHEQEWRKARRVLHGELKRVIETKSAMDGADLMRAIRYRAVIEAGLGNTPGAEWWWHAGLNLQSEGAAPWLDFLPEDRAEPLARMQVRALAPKAKHSGKRPDPKKGEQPTGTKSALHSRANKVFLGDVKFQVRLTERGRFAEPLLESSTASSAVCVYAALDKIGETIYPKSWRRNHPEFFSISVGFLGGELRRSARRGL